MPGLPLARDSGDIFDVDAVACADHPLFQAPGDFLLHCQERLHVDQGFNVVAMEVVLDADLVRHIGREPVVARTFTGTVPPLTHEDHAVAPAAGRKQEVVQSLWRLAL